VARKPKDARSQVVKALTGKPKRRKSRAKFKPFQRLKRNLFRSAVASLKRKGIIPRTIDARKQVPTPALSRTINRNKDVLSGRARAYRLPPDTTAKALREYERLGYRVERKGGQIKLITPPSQYVRKGKIYARPTVSRKGARLEHIQLGPDMEAQIRKAFEGLKPGEFMAFQINGGNSYNVYSNPDSMINDLLSGVSGFTSRQVDTLVLFHVTGSKVMDYYRNTFEIREQQAQRRRERAKERRARQMRGGRGMRVSRGH
jgi:hypothetical protein